MSNVRVLFLYLRVDSLVSHNTHTYLMCFEFFLKKTVYKKSKIICRRYGKNQHALPQVKKIHDQTYSAFLHVCIYACTRYHQATKCEFKDPFDRLSMRGYLNRIWEYQWYGQPIYNSLSGIRLCPTKLVKLD